MASNSNPNSDTNQVGGFENIEEKFGRFRILIIGRANAGKTTILRAICNTTENPEVYDGEGNKVRACFNMDDWPTKPPSRCDQIDMTQVEGSTGVSTICNLNILGLGLDAHVHKSTLAWGTRHRE
jgi:GTPase SAR1 family protein